MSELSDADRKVSQELDSIADELNAKLEQVAGQRMNFSLFVYNSEPGSRVNYISNTKREDVINAMQSCLDNWKAGMPDVKSHEIN